jgi:hypothetical protein
MILIQIKSSDGVAELWFGRRKEIVVHKTKVTKIFATRFFEQSVVLVSKSSFQLLRGELSLHDE